MRKQVLPKKARQAAFAADLFVLLRRSCLHCCCGQTGLIRPELCAVCESETKQFAAGLNGRQRFRGSAAGTVSVQQLCGADL